jgi:hypothetical protein
MVKQVDRYSKQRQLPALRLKGREFSSKMLGLLGFAVGITALSVALSIGSVWAYYHVVPISLIAMFSQDEATLIDGVRKAGCTDAYVHYAMQGPGGDMRMMALKEYKQCVERSMEHPA